MDEVQKTTVQTISPTGVALIKRFESCRLSAYLDQKNVPTIGWGHTAGVKLQDVITQEEADKLLMSDIADVIHALNFMLKPVLTQNQFDALCSFVFNIGTRHFAESTMLRLLNQLQFNLAGQQFIHWIYCDGKINVGLYNRRKAEQDLYYGK